MNTIYLDPTTWSPVVDLNGNIAMASGPYALAQDAASSIKLWLGELYYDTTQGVSWLNIYGRLPPIAYVRAQLVTAAKTVPGVVAAKVFFSSFSQRAIGGQVQVIDDTGVVTIASF